MRFPAQAGSVERVLKTYPSRMSIPASSLEILAYLGSSTTTILKKCTNPITLSRMIFTWSISPNRLKSSLSCSSVVHSSSPRRYTFRLALLCWIASCTCALTGDGFPQPILLLSVQRQLLNCRVGMEGSSSACIKERQKYTQLLGENADRLEWSKMDEI